MNEKAVRVVNAFESKRPYIDIINDQELVCENGSGFI